MGSTRHREGAVAESAWVAFANRRRVSHQFAVSCPLGEHGLLCRELQDQRRVIGQPGNPLLMGIVDDAGASGQIF